jgi:hypothetical protein
VSVNDDQWTCGKGLAANADLPAKLGELMAARAEVLERHAQTLDPTDPDTRPELAAYAELARSHREVAGVLESLGQRMAGCRDLPMGRHDMEVMADPRGQMEAFRRFVAVERELVGLLEDKLAEEQKMLR